jgi:acetylornithine deacetylase/succinyl-diaminopimelate desuccinylase-like protein
MVGRLKWPWSVVAWLIVALAAWIPSYAGSDTAPDIAGEDDAHRGAVARYVAGHHKEILDELFRFLAIPNTSIDVASMRANAHHLVASLERRGMKARLLETDGAPYVFAVLEPEGTPAASPPPTVLFYCHFDGQPVDPARWSAGAPFQPRLDGSMDDPDTRVYARSASDDKSPIIALLTAVDALRSAGIPPSTRAKFIFDPEEEIGSEHLRELLSRHASLLSADLMIFADGPVHQSGHPTVVFGTRGIVTVRLELFGPATHLHSGHYGNWAPNPAEKLAGLLASMKDGEGRVLVEGFYDDVVPLTQSDREAIRAVPPVEGALMEELLIARPDGGGSSLQELINLPSLNIRGLRSAWVKDEARTIIPSTAVAEIDMRLVKGVSPQAQVARIRNHVLKQGYHVVEGEPSEEVRRRHPLVVRLTHGEGVAAARTPTDTPLSRSVIEAVSRATTREPVLMPTLGGTGPLSLFEEILGLPVYAVPIVNPDNNQHGPDENLRLGNLWDGIVIYASLLRLPPPGAD